MKKRLAVLVMIGVMALSFGACGGSKDAPKDNGASSQTEQQTKTDTPKEDTSQGKEDDSKDTKDTKKENGYQSIYDEYTKKLKEAAPKLVKEYKKEAKDKKGDINALAELSTEGIEKMASLMLKNGDKEAIYDEWAEKLTDVYMKQAEKITDAYMESAK